MMRTSLLGLFAQAVVTAAAAMPGLLNQRAACNRDNCLRAVIANSAKPGPVSASQDCVSFFRKTVTSCASDAATSSVTVVTTVTVDAPTTFESLTITYTAATVPLVVDVTYTVTETTVTVPTTVSTVEVRPTETQFVTEIVTVTNAATVYTSSAPEVTHFYNKPVPVKRRQGLAALVDARANDNSCTQTRAPTAVATYASACSGMPTVTSPPRPRIVVSTNIKPLYV